MFRLIVSIVVVLFFCVVAYCDEPSAITLEKIVKSLRVRENAIATLEFRGREFLLDSEGEPKPRTVTEEFEYAQVPGACREYRIRQTGLDGQTSTSEWVREDGEKRYDIFCFPKRRDAISTVLIHASNSTDSRNQLRTFGYLHCLTPRGIRLSDLVSTGVIRKVSDDPAGYRTISLEVKDDSYQFDLELSEEHDFMVKTIDFGRPPFYRVSKFRSFDGIWFPVEGVRQNKNSEGSVNTCKFIVDELRINATVNSNRFSMPPLLKGTRIIDSTKKGLDWVYGAPNPRNDEATSARRLLQAKYSLPNESDSIPVKTVTTSTSREPEHSSVNTLLMICSTLMLTSVVLFRFLPRRA